MDSYASFIESGAVAFGLAPTLISEHFTENRPSWQSVGHNEDYPTSDY
jgi:hypothetical protein